MNGAIQTKTKGFYYCNPERGPAPPPRAWSPVSVREEETLFQLLFHSFKGVAAGGGAPCQTYPPPFEMAVIYDKRQPGALKLLIETSGCASLVYNF